MTDLEKTIDDLKLLNALCHGTVLDDAIALLKGQQQIVRCKDCKYNDDGECVIKAGWFPVKPDWFCADGERRTDDA